MNKYCLVIDGVVINEPTSLPTIYEDKTTGTRISGFNNLDNDSLLQYGWMPVVIDDSDRREYSVANGHVFQIQNNQIVQINKYCHMTQKEFYVREEMLLSMEKK